MYMTCVRSERTREESERRMVVTDNEILNFDLDYKKTIEIRGAPSIEF